MTQRVAVTAKNAVKEKSEVARCQDDEFRIGGGAKIKGSDDVHLLRTQPKPGGWQGKAKQDANDDADWRLKVFVLCVER